MDGIEIFGFYKVKPGPVDQIPNQEENRPLGIDSGEWERAGQKSKPSRGAGEFPVLPPGIHEVVASKVWTWKSTAGHGHSLALDGPSTPNASL